jgi:hypothetical protein
MIRYDYDEDGDEVPVIRKMTLDVRLARPFRMAKPSAPSAKWACTWAFAGTSGRCTLPS